MKGVEDERLELTDELSASPVIVSGRKKPRSIEYDQLISSPKRFNRVIERMNEGYGEEVDGTVGDGFGVVSPVRRRRFERDTETIESNSDRSDWSEYSDLGNKEDPSVTPRTPHTPGMTGQRFQYEDAKKLEFKPRKLDFGSPKCGINKAKTVEFNKASEELGLNRIVKTTGFDGAKAVSDGRPKKSERDAWESVFSTPKRDAKVYCLERQRKAGDKSEDNLEDEDESEEELGGPNALVEFNNIIDLERRRYAERAKEQDRNKNREQNPDNNRKSLRKSHNIYGDQRSYLDDLHS